MATLKLDRCSCRKRSQMFLLIAVSIMRQRLFYSASFDPIGLFSKLEEDYTSLWSINQSSQIWMKFCFVFWRLRSFGNCTRFYAAFTRMQTFGTQFAVNSPWNLRCSRKAMANPMNKDWSRNQSLWATLLQHISTPALSFCLSMRAACPGIPSEALWGFYNLASEKNAYRAISNSAYLYVLFTCKVVGTLWRF